MKKLFQSDLFIGLGLSLVVFLVYLHTLAPSIVFLDSGELATVAATLGIAHPTGYPLFTLLGWVWVHLPFGGTAVWKLNLMAAVFCSAAVFFFYRLFLRLLSEKSLGTSPRIASACGVLIFAFSATYWAQAVSVEVYSLHILFLSIVILLFLLALGASGTNRVWALFAFTLGLSFTNHMTTVLLAPAFLYLFFATQGLGRDAWRKIGQAIAPFLIGLSPYLYLPIRASQNPLMNWGNPDNLSRLWRHVSGAQYRFMMYSSFEVPLKQLRHFTAGFAGEFGTLPLVFGLLGFFVLFRTHRRLWIFSLLLFAGCLFYSLNYDIADIDSYFLLACFSTALWIVYGLSAFLKFASNRKWKWPVRAVCFVMVLFPLCLNYHRADESRDYAVEDYVRNVLEPLDSNAVLFSGQESNFSNAALYLQAVEKVRPDVIAVNYQQLMFPWYYRQLKNRWPGVFQNPPPEIETYVETYDENEIDSAAFARRNEIVLTLIRRYSGLYPVYVTSDLLPLIQGLNEFRAVPAGLSFRLLASNVAPPPPQSTIFSYRPLTHEDSYLEIIRTFYAGAYLNQGVYWAMSGNPATGADFVRKALQVKPDFTDAQVWLQRLGATPAP